MIFAALCFTCAVFVSVSAKCTRSTSCPCGSSSKNYTLCVDDVPTTTDPCVRWGQCQTCQEELSNCLTCKPGFYGPTCSKVAGLKKIRKKRQTVWSDGTFQIGTCPALSAPSSGLIRCRPSTRRGRCSGKCKPGFTFQNNENEAVIILECRRTGWYPNPFFPTCVEGIVRSDCPDPETSPDLVRYPPARSFPGTFQEFESVSFSCTDRNAVIVGESTITCEAGGTWSAPTPRCVVPEVEESPCTFPGVDPNGQVFMQSSTPGQLDREEPLPPGTRLIYSCKNGYNREGTESILCLPSGEWSGFYPNCISQSPETGVSCPNPGPIHNGEVTASLPSVSRPENRPSGYPLGTNLTYSCGVGYVLHGVENIVCQESGRWSARQPWCIERCGVSTLEANRRITHGILTLAGEWPWIVGISVYRNGFPELTCGGALLNRRTVVTAAHCISPDEPYYVLHFGKYYRRFSQDGDNVEVRRSFRAISHPDFNKDTYANDIALIQFSPPISYSETILPICLPTTESTVTNLVPNKIGYVAGWGFNEVDLRPDALMMAKLPVQSDSTCMSAFQKENIDFQIVPGMFCAGYPEGGMSTCRGDSGSAIVFYDRNTTRFTIEGCVSFSVRGSCGTAGRYTVFTKVRQFVKWIRKNWRT